ncbi:hypothetical protein CTheo_1360 [Ceratobasidium theobromae]|uniref:Uncharacterized protein n=1 Tax=Ceratobasidium theobromae TaxID=1582974 RepID=A0A5N5QU44_9AGAM|nr:hypothetical protein CTheo_1360 [Ceratobasidium theobromae]
MYSARSRLFSNQQAKLAIKFAPLGVLEPSIGSANRSRSDAPSTTTVRAAVSEPPSREESVLVASPPKVIILAARRAAWSSWLFGIWRPASQIISDEDVLPGILTQFLINFAYTQLMYILPTKI